MPKQMITAIGLIISLGVIALGFFLVALPLYFQAAGVDRQTANIASTNAVYQSQVDHLRAQKDNLEQVTANVAALRTEIPATGQFDDVFEVIGRAAVASGVELDSIAVGESAGFEPRTGAEEDTRPEPEPEEPADGGSPTDPTVPAPAPVSPSTDARQQVEININVTATDMGQATAFLDALRAGPRLLNSVSTTIVLSSENTFAVRVSALTYVDVER